MLTDNFIKIAEELGTEGGRICDGSDALSIHWRCRDVRGVCVVLSESPELHICWSRWGDGTQYPTLADLMAADAPAHKDIGVARAANGDLIQTLRDGLSAAQADLAATKAELEKVRKEYRTVCQRMSRRVAAMESERLDFRVRRVAVVGK